MTMREIAIQFLESHGWQIANKQTSGKWIAMDKEGKDYRYFVNKSRGDAIRRGRSISNSIAVKLQNGSAGIVVC